MALPCCGDDDEENGAGLLAKLLAFFKASFWMVDVEMPSALHPFFGAAPTRAELALILGGGFLFALMPMVFYSADALPPQGWQRSLFFFVNFHLCGGAISHLTDDTYSYWHGKGKTYLQSYIFLNGIALLFLVFTMPNSLVICFATYLLATGTAIAASIAPVRIIKPLCMTGAALSTVICLGLGASSAAAPSCVMYILFTCLSLTIQHAPTLNLKGAMPLEA
jgi:hypothetical protein